MQVESERMHVCYLSAPTIQKNPTNPRTGRSNRCNSFQGCPLSRSPFHFLPLTLHESGTMGAL
jgi:hypothetical protein